MNTRRFGRTGIEISELTLGAGFVGVYPVETLGDIEIGDPGRRHSSVSTAPGHVLAPLHGSVHDATHRDAADVWAGIKVGDPGLEGMLGVMPGRVDGLDQCFEHGAEVGARLEGIECCSTSTSVCVNDWEVDLILGCVEVQEQFVHFVHDFGDAGVRAIDLVDHQHHR